MILNQKGENNIYFHVPPGAGPGGPDGQARGVDSMEVLFVHSEADYLSRERPLAGNGRMQFGISYISSLLKRKGHETRLVIPTPGNEDLVDEAVRDFNPGLVCFTSVYAVFEYLSEVAARVKRRNPDVFLLAGGTHVSLDPDGCLDAAFDAVCVGEGEYPTLELVEQLERGKAPRGIANLWIKDGNGTGIERNDPRPFIEDLDSIPFPDRGMWIPWYTNPLSTPSILTGRGCPFQCTYCCNHALARLSKGRYVRVRSPENIVAEVRSFKEILPLIEDIYLEAETLGSNTAWALELCSRLEELNADYEVPCTFSSNLRVTPNKDYSELFSAMRRANFYSVNIGLESGSEHIRRDVLKRNYSNEDIMRTVVAARENGLMVGFYNLIGIPGETRADFRETVRMNRACQPNSFLLSIFVPYPGTSLYETCREQGLLKDRPDLRLERRQCTLDLPGFSKRQIRRRVTWSHFLFYRGKRPLRKILPPVFFARIYQSPTLCRAWLWLSGRFSPHKKFQEEEQRAEA